MVHSHAPGGQDKRIITASVFCRLPVKDGQNAGAALGISLERRGEPLLVVEDLKPHFP